MPYKSDKINLKKKLGLDRRIKLTEKQKQEIQYLYFNNRHKSTLKVLSEGISQRTLAKKYGVSRRSIVWILYPERLEHNKQLRMERGGWKQYYNTAKNTITQRKHRAYKHKLYLKGII